ncbi:MAG: alkene reductase [Gemmatimonadaceae bacterium]|nr:alkene reductase [Gemmatimonadaceae bacterium]
MARFPQLLSPVRLGALRLPNRVLMAPMTRSRAHADGTVPDITAEYFAQRATAGLMITDATMISLQAVGYPNTPCLFTDAHLVAWQAVTRAVHAASGRIALQLNHVGRLVLPAFQPDGAAPVAPSPIRAEGVVVRGPALEEQPAPEPRALELPEIAAIVAQFGAAARRARVAGFDAVEIHAGNGFLIDQFLRDGVNRRYDRFGGSPENRARFLLAVTEAVAREVGADRTGVRLTPLSPTNDMRDTDPVTTFGTALRQLSTLDIAWAHLGDMDDNDTTRRLRDAYGKPFVLNGGFTPDSANDAIKSELAIAVSFASSYIANPDLVERFRLGAALAKPDRATFYTGGARGYVDYPTLAETPERQD